jgi:hypothetical protein
VAFFFEPQFLLETDIVTEQREVLKDTQFAGIEKMKNNFQEQRTPEHSEQ